MQKREREGDRVTEKETVKKMRKNERERRERE